MGRPAAKTLYEDRGYFDWIQNKEFSVQVKQLTRELRDKYASSQEK